jgi:hypothetical protein
VQSPENERADAPPTVENLKHAGDELLKRAKKVAQASEERMRKVLGTGDTKPSAALPDGTTGEVPPSQ